MAKALGCERKLVWGSPGQNLIGVCSNLDGNRNEMKLGQPRTFKAEPKVKEIGLGQPRPGSD